MQIYMPDIEHIYMSEKKSNHVQEKYGHLKNAPMLAGENAQSVAGKIRQT